MLHCILVFRRNADTESAKACRIEWVLANFVPFKDCRFVLCVPALRTIRSRVRGSFDRQRFAASWAVSGHGLDQGVSKVDKVVDYPDVGGNVK